MWTLWITHLLSTCIDFSVFVWFVLYFSSVLNICWRCDSLMSPSPFFALKTISETFLHPHSPQSENCSPAFGRQFLHFLLNIRSICRHDNCLIYGRNVVCLIVLALGREQGLLSWWWSQSCDRGPWCSCISGEGWASHAPKPTAPEYLTWNMVCVCVCVCIWFDKHPWCNFYISSVLPLSMKLPLLRFLIFYKAGMPFT